MQSTAKGARTNSEVMSSDGPLHAVMPALADQ